MNAHTQDRRPALLRKPKFIQYNKKGNKESRGHLRYNEVI